MYLSVFISKFVSVSISKSISYSVEAYPELSRALFWVDAVLGSMSKDDVSYCPRFRVT